MVCIWSLSWRILHIEYWITIWVSSSSSGVICSANWSFSFGYSLIILIISVIFSWRLGLVTGSDFIHEVAIKHGLPHLLLVLVHFAVLTWIICTKSSLSCLIENMLFLLFWNIWQHFMNSRVVGWLQHNTVVSGIHFVNTEGSVLSLNTFFLFSHAVCHEESLVLFWRTKSIK